MEGPHTRSQLRAKVLKCESEKEIFRAALEGLATEHIAGGLACCSMCGMRFAIEAKPQHEPDCLLASR